MRDGITRSSSTHTAVDAQGFRLVTILSIEPTTQAKHFSSFSRVIKIVSRGVTQPYAHVRTNGPPVSQMGRHSPHSPHPFPTVPGAPSKAEAAHRVSLRLVCIVLLLSSEAGLPNGPCSSLGAVFATPKFWDSLLSR